MIHPEPWLKEESMKAYLRRFPFLLKVIYLPDKPGISRLVTAEYHIHTTSKSIPEAQNVHFLLGTQTTVALDAVQCRSHRQPYS